MQTLDRDSAEIVVAASADELYDLVADVTRTPEFSPEVVSARWLDGATGAAVGARFESVNASAVGHSHDGPVAPPPAASSPSSAPRPWPVRSSGGTASSRSTEARAWWRATRWSGPSAASAGS